MFFLLKTNYIFFIADNFIIILGRSKMNKQLLVIITAFLLFFSFYVVAEENIITNETYASFYGEPYNGRPTASGEIFDMNAFTAAHKTLPFGTIVEVTNLENGKKVIVKINDRGPFVGNREIDLSRAAAEKLGMIAQGITRVSLRRVDPGNISAISEAGKNNKDLVNKGNNGRGIYENSSGESFRDNDLREAASPEYGNTYNQTKEEKIDAYSSSTPYAASNLKKSPVSLVYTPANSDETSGVLWRIQLGAFTREENALRLVVRLREIGFEPAYEKTDSHVRVVLYGIRSLDLEKVKQVLEVNNLKNYVIRQESW